MTHTRSERWARLSVLALSAAVGLFVGGGYFLSSQGARPGTYEGLEVLAQAYSLVTTRFVEPVDDARLGGSSYRALAESCDAYSSYLSAKEVRELSKRRSPDADVGLDLVKQHGYAYIVSVRRGSPAEEAGIKPGQYVHSVGGGSTRAMTLHQVRSVLRGKPDTEVTLSLVDSGEGGEEKITLKRRALSEEPVIQKRPEARYIVPPPMAQSTLAAWKALLQKTAPDLPLVLDLRRFVSQDFEAALEIADFLLEEGETARIKTVSEESVRFAEPERIDAPERLVFLVDGSTAGAPELLAAVLHEYAGATLVGDRTFGWGRAQELVELSSGAALWISTREYFLAGGEPLEGQGLMPDRPQADDPETPEDEVLDAALSALKENATS
ncbi:MAG: PDZ domain-containing protein [Acidobacteriota bacterium]|nr:MAG: PDZ domain-containing protein [Acidobacteriota bacterium]